MQIEITYKFQKQVEECKDRRIKSKVLSIIEAVKVSENLNGFPNLKKLTAYKNSYRIRMGDYRIGILKTDTVIGNSLKLKSLRLFPAI